MQPRQIGDGQFRIGAGNVKFRPLLADIGVGHRDLIARLLQLANGRCDIGARQIHLNDIVARVEFDQEIAYGSLYLGSPETVAKKIAETVRMLKLSRFDLKYSAGGLSHARIMSTLDLYAKEVMPRVRQLLS